MSKLDKKLVGILNKFVEDTFTPGGADLIPYIKEIKDLFGYEDTLPLEERKEMFKTQCREELLQEDRSNAKMLGDFYLYWTEHPEKVTSRTKMKWEKERDKKSFNLKLRYATWEKRSKQYSIVGMLNKRG